MTDLQIRDEFRKLVIMGNHPECEMYEEAIKKDFVYGKSPEIIGELRQYVLLEDWLSELDNQMEQSFYEGIDIATGAEYQPITIGRVMQALEAKSISYDETLDNGTGTYRTRSFLLNDWKLTKDNGQECTADDQYIETIKKLLLLLKK